MTVTFSDGSEFASDLSVIPGSDVDSQAVLGQGAPPAPAIARAAGASSPAVVTSAAQTVVVSGPIGATGRVLVAEGRLDVSDVPGGGVDLDAFEANTVARITQIPFTIGAGGTVERAGDPDGDLVRHGERDRHQLHHRVPRGRHAAGAGLRRRSCCTWTGPRPSPARAR